MVVVKILGQIGTGAVFLGAIIKACQVSSSIPTLKKGVVATSAKLCVVLRISFKFCIIL